MVRVVNTLLPDRGPSYCVNRNNSLIIYSITAFDTVVEVVSTSTIEIYEMSFKTTFSHLLIHAFSEVHQPQFPRVRCPVSWTFFCEIHARPVVWIGTTVISSLSVFSAL